MTNNPHVMSMYATEIDCLRARDKWFQEKHKQLIELSRLQNEALQQSMGMMDEYSYRATLRGDKGYDTLRTISAFNRFERGE